MENISENLSNFLKFIREVKSTEKLYSEYEDVENKKTQDILHKIEFETLKRDEKAKLVTKLQQIRRDRRAYKDTRELIAPLYEYFNTDQMNKVVHDLEEILGKIRKKEKLFEEGRTYVPRELKDGEYFD